MKTFYPHVVALFALLAVFSTSYAQYDDIYYTPENDLTYNNEATYNNDVSSAQYEWTDEDEYAQNGSDTYITNNYYGNDYFYSSRIKRFRRPVSRFGYYNSCYTDLYYYDYSPYSCGTSIYYNNYNPGWYVSSPFIVLNFGSNWCRPRYSNYNYNYNYNYNAFCSPNYYSASYYNPYSYNNYGYNNSYYGNNAYCGPGNNGNYYTTTNGGPRTGRVRIIRNSGNTRSNIQTAGTSNGKEELVGTTNGSSKGKTDRFNDQPIKNAPVKSVKDRYETDQPQWSIKGSNSTTGSVKDTKLVNDEVHTIKKPKYDTNAPVKSVKPSTQSSVKAQKPRTDDRIKSQNPRTNTNTIKTQKPRSQSTYQKPRTDDSRTTIRSNPSVKSQKPRTNTKPTYTKPPTRKPSYTKPRTTSKRTYKKPKTSKPSYSKPKTSSSKNRSTTTKSRSTSSSKGRR